MLGKWHLGPSWTDLVDFDLCLVQLGLNLRLALKQKGICLKRNLPTAPVFLYLASSHIYPSNLFFYIIQTHVMWTRRCGEILSDNLARGFYFLCHTFGKIGKDVWQT